MLDEAPVHVLAVHSVGQRNVRSGYRAAILETGHHCTFKSTIAAGTDKGTVTVLLGPDTPAGVAVSPTCTSKECPEMTFALHVPVAVTGGMVTEQDTTLPGRPGVGTLMSYSWMPPIWLSGNAVESVRTVGHVHVNVLVTALAGNAFRIMNRPAVIILNICRLQHGSTA
jgi:hypothetical protein